MTLTGIRGKYDEAYIEYTIKLMRKAKVYGFRICELK